MTKMRYVVPFVSILIVSLGQAQAALIGYWAGEGNAADSAGPNSGTLVNGVTFGPGVIGQAFGFDGVSYVKAPTTGVPTGNQDRTLALWFRVDQFQTEESFFAGYGAFGSFDEAYSLGTSNGFIFFSQWGQAIFGPQVQAGTWHHLAVTNVGDTETLYLDGVGVGTSSLPINTAPGNNFFIGRIPGPVGDIRQLDGFVDEVKIYDTALSAAEIRRLAAVPEPASVLLIAVGAAMIGLANRCRSGGLVTA